MNLNKIIQIKEDSHCLEAIHALPTTADGSGLIILHEIFGLTPFITNVCNYWSKRGYSVIAPALYDRYDKHVNIPYDEHGYKKALDYKQRVLNWDKQLLDVAAAQNFLLRKNLKKIHIIGFSWGGTLAWLSAARLEKISSIVAYYGTHFFNFKDERPKSPVLLHFADFDELISLENFKQVQISNPAINFIKYPVGHGFCCPFWKEYNTKYAAIADKETENL
ncbi:dienelactone hydrolase family protein [Legionella gresilensis]|uniref:dienelactone hydrolase family protein n=1 Tax=Legionella gresilensis TaxID=91823 RepID=UPI0013EFB2F0|nr:dienelactone hydrolase family protein [Legionella gresilensis]